MLIRQRSSVILAKLIIPTIVCSLAGLGCLVAGCEPATRTGLQTVTLAQDSQLQIQAEEMQLDGYVVESKWYEDEYIATYNVGKAWLPFPGQSGVYKLKLFILEENDGEPRLNLYVAGDHIASIKYRPGNSQRDPRTVVLDEVYLEQGEEVLLIGREHESAGARVDKLVFCLVRGGQASIEAENMKLSNYQIESGDGYAGTFIATYSTGSTRIGFPGRDDFYNVSLTIVAENDGQPELDLFIGRDHIQTIAYPLGESPRDPKTIDFGLWWIARGDLIRLVGYRMANGMARVDRIDFKTQ